MARRWSEGEMLVAIYLYRFGEISHGMSLAQVAERLDRSEDAIQMRLLDLKAIDKPEEYLPGFGASSELVRVWGYARQLDRTDLLSRVEKFLSSL